MLENQLFKTSLWKMLSFN